MEQSRLRALVERNMALAWQLHSPDFELVTPGGTRYSRAQYLGDVESGQLNYLRWTPGDMWVRMYPQVVLLRYQAALEMGDSPANATSFRCWHTDAYEQRDGLWQVVLSQATLIR
ncbi:nuclear transport factor 2 family protein [Ideonella sp. BN130291]|uniref:nuclear transport factor 2 family protein n=1 Tax=Ideonella sp. BN130291 TaxID=3112940 RepID=UPI002E260A98|nr:nuclear transport factor 2 family protein [Ideonella sp. BN130291]